jgi:hypothetical protein
MYNNIWHCEIINQVVVFQLVINQNKTAGDEE